MSGNAKFVRDFATWGPDVKSWEKANEVGYVITRDILNYGGDAFYPVGALMGAKISGQWLGEGDMGSGDTENLDLLLRMTHPESKITYIEIILRSKTNSPYYAEYLEGGEVEITDEIVNGHRVLISTDGNFKFRYEFDGFQYSLIGVLTLAGQPTSSTTAWRAAMKRRAGAKQAA
nr:hypothetical protein [Pseudomonadota bacterium]